MTAPLVICPAALASRLKILYREHTNAVDVSTPIGYPQV